MLVLKALILFNLGLVLSQPYLRKRFESQTLISVTIKGTPKFKLCKCSNGKCEIDITQREAACKVIKQRYAYWAEPSPYFVICEFEHQQCDKSKTEDIPTYVMRITYDAFYLTTSSFNFGKSTGEQIARQIINRHEHFPSELFQSEVANLKAEHGVVGMPVEMVGETTVPVSEFAMYEFCHQVECVKKMDDFCKEVADSMKAASARLMKQYIGCAIRHIYVQDNTVRIAWSMMFHHRRLIESKTVSTAAQLRELIEAATKNIKSSFLKSYEVNAAIPLDYCIITASSVTTQKYHKDLWDSLSHRYLIDSHMYYKLMRRQLVAGNRLFPTCLRDLSQMRMTKEGDLSKVSMEVWVSLTCAKKHKLKTCKDVANELKEQWLRGDKIYHSFWTPDYQFTAASTGLHFKD